VACGALWGNVVGGVLISHYAGLDPNSSILTCDNTKGTSYLIGPITQSYCEEADGDLYCLGAPSGFCVEPDNP
jgi:hypothetical protein